MIALPGVSIESKSESDCSPRLLITDPQEQEGGSGARRLGGLSSVVKMSSTRTCHLSLHLSASQGLHLKTGSTPSEAPAIQQFHTELRVSFAIADELHLEDCDGFGLRRSPSSCNPTDMAPPSILKPAKHSLA